MLTRSMPSKERRDPTVTASTSALTPHLLTPLRCLRRLLFPGSQRITLLVALPFALQIGGVSSLAFLFAPSTGIGR